MEPVILIFAGKGAPKILAQLRELKVTLDGNRQAIQTGLQEVQLDLDAMQRVADSNLMSKSKIEDGLFRIMRNMSGVIGIRCVLRHMADHGN